MMNEFINDMKVFFSDFTIKEVLQGLLAGFAVLCAGYSICFIIAFSQGYFL